MERVSALLYLEINITALIIMAVVLLKSIHFSRMESHTNFLAALSGQMFFTFTDAVFHSVLRNVLPYNGVVLILFKSLHLVSTVAVAYLWLLYFEELQGNAIRKNRRLFIYTSLGCWLVLYIAVINLFSHTIFYIDSEGLYQRGSWYYVVQYIIPLIYVYFICRRAVQNAFANRNKPEGRIFVTYAIFPLPAVIATFLQYRFPEYPLLNISLALTTLILYVNSMDEVVSIDPLTQMSNRRQFMKTFSLWFSSRNEAVPMYYMIIDVDKFKHINDRYGHSEGDVALVRVADTLKAACSKQRRKAIAARYGGDEFVLLVEADGDDEANKLITQINRTLQEKDQEAHAPYKLSLSIGFARLDEAKTIKAVMDLADERQYEMKIVHHRIIEAEEKGIKPDTKETEQSSQTESEQ